MTFIMSHDKTLLYRYIYNNWKYSIDGRNTGKLRLFVLKEVPYLELQSEGCAPYTEER